MNKITVYKYRFINEYSLITLETSKMWFSKPSNLNDTFEFSVPIFIEMSPNEIISHYEKRFNVEYTSQTLLSEMMKHGGSNKFPATEEFINNFLSSNLDNWYLFFIALIHFHREQGCSTEEIAHHLQLDTNPYLRKRLEDELRNAYNRNQAIGLECGVLSLANKKNNPLMWAHYADSCKGMCIGITLDIDSLLSTDYIPLWVEYNEELPILNPDSFFNNKSSNLYNMIKLFYGTKYKAWEHEKEFRLISKKGDAEYLVPGQITEIILGEKVSDKDAKQVYDSVKKNNNITKVGFFKMMREPGTWKYKAYGESI